MATPPRPHHTNNTSNGLLARNLYRNKENRTRINYEKILPQLQLGLTSKTKGHVAPSLPRRAKPGHFSARIGFKLQALILVRACVYACVCPVVYRA